MGNKNILKRRQLEHKDQEGNINGIIDK